MPTMNGLARAACISLDVSQKHQWSKKFKQQQNLCAVMLLISMEGYTWSCQGWDCMQPELQRNARNGQRQDQRADASAIAGVGVFLRLFCPKLGGRYVSWAWAEFRSCISVGECVLLESQPCPEARAPQRWLMKQVMCFCLPFSFLCHC